MLGPLTTLHVPEPLGIVLFADNVAELPTQTVCVELLVAVVGGVLLLRAICDDGEISVVLAQVDDE